MQSLQEQIKIHEQEINAFSPADANELEAYRIKYLGTKGVVKAIFGEMKNVPAEQKKEAGQVLNAFKQLAEEIIRFEARTNDTNTDGDMSASRAA